MVSMNCRRVKVTTPKRPIAPMIFDRLVRFRQTLYAMIDCGKDALFNLMDAALTSPDVTSFVRISQSPLFRRQWPSLYSALRTARLPRQKLMKQLVQEVAGIWFRCWPAMRLYGLDWRL